MGNKRRGWPTKVEVLIFFPAWPNLQTKSRHYVWRQWLKDSEEKCYCYPTEVSGVYKDTHRAFVEEERTVITENIVTKSKHNSHVYHEIMTSSFRLHSVYLQIFFVEYCFLSIIYPFDFFLSQDRIFRSDVDNVVAW